MSRFLSVFSLKASSGVFGGASALVVALFLGAAAPVQALDHTGEEHCFTRNGVAPVLYPEDRYANGTMQEEDQVKAVEELTSRQWTLRLTSLPFTRDQGIFYSQFEDGLNGKTPRYSDLDAYASIMLEEAEERRNRRTGSRYMHVTPQMKMLARERSEIRNLKQKPCSPHILYLG